MRTPPPMCPVCQTEFNVALMRDEGAGRQGHYLLKCSNGHLYTGLFKRAVWFTLTSVEEITFRPW